MRHKAFLTICLGFLAGIAAASFLPLGLSHALLGVVTGLALLAAAAAMPSVRTLALLVALGVFALSLGIGRFAQKDAREQPQLLDRFVGESVVLHGMITSEVEERQSSQRFTLAIDGFESGDASYPAQTKLAVSTELFPRLRYGDEVTAKGTLAVPEDFMTDTGTMFGYRNYLKKDSIYYTLSFASVEVLSDGHGNPVTRLMLSAKARFLDSIERAVPAPESALLSGLLLGVKSSLGEDLRQDFIDTGLVHVIVLSGYNVTIVAEALVAVLSAVSIAVGIYAGGIFIVLFVILAGAGATVIRAAIMAALALIARAVGRGYDIMRALLLAAVIMVFQNPYILAFDISFQLSFLATVGLIYMTPLFERFVRFMPNILSLREILASTLGVQLFVMPFILYKMGNLSLVAPFANILVLPLVPATMLFGFLTGLGGLLVPLLAVPFAFASYALLHFEIGAVQFFASLPFASLTIARLPLAIVIMSYLFIGYAVYRQYRVQSHAAKI